jgi:hypothetical protein
MTEEPIIPRNEVTDYWNTFDPKPTLLEFQKSIVQRFDKPITMRMIRRWRTAGALPGKLPKSIPPQNVRKKEDLQQIVDRDDPEQVAEAVRTISRKAKKSARYAAALDVTFDRELLRRVAARAVLFSDAYMAKLIKDIEKIEINSPAAVAGVANAAALMLDKVASIAESLNLLDQAEATTTQAHRPEPKVEEVSNITSIRERIAAAAAAARSDK